MTNEEMARLMSSGSTVELSAAVQQAMDRLEKLKRGIIVAGLFSGKETPAFKDGMAAIEDDEFLRDLEHFGGALASAATRQRARITVQRMGDGYKRGA